MKKLIKKLQDKGKKDPANLSKKELKKYQEEERVKSMKEFDKQQLQEKTMHRTRKGSFEGSTQLDGDENTPWKGPGSTKNEPRRAPRGAHDHLR